MLIRIYLEYDDEPMRDVLVLQLSPFDSVSYDIQTRKRNKSIRYATIKLNIDE